MNTATEDTQSTVETAATFEAYETEQGEMEVVEFDNAPLTDINFGF